MVVGDAKLSESAKIAGWECSGLLLRGTELPEDRDRKVFLLSCPVEGMTGGCGMFGITDAVGLLIDVAELREGVPVFAGDFWVFQLKIGAVVGVVIELEG